MLKNSFWRYFSISFGLVLNITENMDCKNVFKYLVFVLNMTLVLGGVVLLGIGVHVYLDMAMHRPIMGNEYHHVSLVLIILGLSTFLVALLGCLGSYKEYVFVVIINAVCYSVLTLGLFGVVAWLILQKVILKNPGKKSWKNLWVSVWVTIYLDAF